METTMIYGVLKGFDWDNGKENGNYQSRGSVGLYWDNEKWKLLFP